MSMMNRFTKQEFLTNGTWTAPAGVTRILIWGMGGGSGGAGGGAGVYSSSLLSWGGYGGTAVSLQPFVVTVVPNTTYSITIGTGGTGGTGGAAGIFSGGAGGNGGSSIFGNFIIEWKGAVRPSASSPQIIPSNSFWNVSVFDGSSSTYEIFPNGGKFGAGPTGVPFRGYPGRLGLSASPGSIGVNANPGTGGGGGAGQTGEAIGGAGGSGVNNAVGGVGGNAPANSGAGGGGGAGGAASKAGGNGGNGGSGKIVIMWVE